jgi:hypothetical protein
MKSESYVNIKETNGDIKAFEVCLMIVFSKKYRLNNAPFELLKSGEINFHHDINQFGKIHLIR